MARSLSLLALAGAAALAAAARKSQGPVDRTWKALTKKYKQFLNVNLRTGGVPPRVTYGAGGAKTYSWSSEGGVQYTWAEMTVTPTASVTPSNSPTPSTTSTSSASATPSPGVVAWLPDATGYDGYSGVFGVAWTAPSLAGAKAGGELPPGAEDWFIFTPPGVCILVGGEQDPAQNVVDPATGKQRYGFVATFECRDDATGLPPAGFSVTLSMPGASGVLAVQAPPSPSPTPSGTPSNSGTPSGTGTASRTPTPSNTPTPSATPSSTTTLTATPSSSSTTTLTGSPTSTPSLTRTPTPTKSPCVVPSDAAYYCGVTRNGGTQGKLCSYQNYQPWLLRCNPFGLLSCGAYCDGTATTSNRAFGGNEWSVAAFDSCRGIIRTC